MSATALEDLHEAFTTLYAEVGQEGSESGLRYSLVDHLFTDALGWSRSVGEGHVNFEDERKDVLCYDDSDPPFPVVVCETKRPSHDLDLDDVEQLETYMNGVGSAEYGILTNGHEFRFYDYDGDDRAVSVVEDFEIGAVAETDFRDLSDGQRNALGELECLHHSRFVDLGDAEYFRETYQEVPVQYQPATDDEGYELFLDAVTDSLDLLTDLLERFFQNYRERPAGSYPRSFLDSTFSDWKDWREYTGKSGNAEETFCRETAYIVLNRALFARIAEDKEIVGRTRLSSHGMADGLDRDERPYLEALIDIYDDIDDHYPDLYELGIFDWWWVSRDKRTGFDDSERRQQADLEDSLDHTLGTVLKRLNRFDFEYVNRDILGHVYEDYLPKQERKELGEYYTSIEVVQFMLDSVDYRPGEDLGQKQVLDPACGSGTFLTEVTERIIQHYIEKFDRTSIHKLNADEARTILERVEENVYGIDINPFAAHITQINLLFRTIDLYDKVIEENPRYTMDGFEIHVADTLSPTPLERQDGSTDTESQQPSLEQFEEDNGRVRSFVEDRNEADRIKDMEFDVVVANPPYVRIQNLSGMKETYSARYSTAIENFDIYIPFIERGLEWVSDDGKLTYICPDRLVNADYAEKIRERLVSEPLIDLIDFKETDVFDVPTPYPCIFTLDREQSVEGNEINCARFVESRDGSLDEIYRLSNWQTPENVDEYELFTYPQENLREDNQDDALSTWKPMPKSEREVFDKIENNADLRVEGVMDEVFQGLATSADTVYTGHIVEELGDGFVKFRPRAGEGYTVIERDILRKVLKGKEIERWKVDWQGLWLVFPYDESGESADLLSQEKLKNGYPKAWEFFEEYEDELKGRESGRMEGRDDWYGYIYPKNLTKFRPPKVMLGVLRQESSFVPDPAGEYYFVGGGTAGGYGLHVRDEYVADEDDLLYFAAILNSKVLEFYHKHVSFIFNGKYYSYGRTFLEPHPITEPEEDLKRKVVERAESIKSRFDEVAELGYRVSDIRNYLPQYEQDSTIVALAISVDLDDDDYRQGPIRTDDKMEGSSEEVYQVVMKRGHVLEFENRSVRDFVFELLKAQDKRLGRMEILNVAVPTRDDVQALVDEYESDRARIEELEEEAEELQAELDDVILRDVYDLDDEDVAVVDEFLEVW